MSLELLVPSDGASSQSIALFRRPLSGVSDCAYQQNPNTADPARIVTASDAATSRDGHEKWRSPSRPTADDALFRIVFQCFSPRGRRKRSWIPLYFSSGINTPTLTHFFPKNVEVCAVQRPRFCLLRERLQPQCCPPIFAASSDRSLIVN